MKSETLPEIHERDCAGAEGQAQVRQRAPRSRGMQKIVVNMGISASLEKSALDRRGEGPCADHGPQGGGGSKSRHSIANFKLREGPADRVPGDVAEGRDV